MKFTQKVNTPYLYTNIRALCAAKGLSIAELERSAALVMASRTNSAAPSLSLVMVFRLTASVRMIMGEPIALKPLGTQAIASWKFRQPRKRM